MVKGTLEHYQKIAAPAIQKELALKNVNQIPRIEKIVLNMGLGAAKENKNIMTDALKALAAISGQKAEVRVATKSVAGFKLREGMNIGARVTLRKERMWNYLSRLINVYIPRVRDFHGINNKAFDGKGNYTLGVNDCRIFTELDIDLASALPGLSITIVTSAESNVEAFSLLKAVGLPYSN